MKKIDYEVPRMSSQEVMRRSREGDKPFIIDVRRDPENTHIQGSMRLEPEDLEAADHIVLPVPKKHLIVLYCTEPREATSASLARKLREQGYTEAYALLNGYEGWLLMEYPIAPRTTQKHVALKH